MANVLKIGRKGELVLPRNIRKDLNLSEGDELMLTVENDAIVLRRKSSGLGAYIETLSRTSTNRSRG